MSFNVNSAYGEDAAIKFSATIKKDKLKIVLSGDNLDETDFFLSKEKVEELKKILNSIR